MSSENSNLWHDAMKEEIAFMDKNQVLELLNYQKELNLLVVNGSIRPKEIHLDSFRIVMELVAHFDSELHKMDVKTAFVNEDLEEEAYIKAIQELSIGKLLRRLCTTYKELRIFK
ncbi:UNVERIFIED_CONTAM: hypothetical protein Scaly_2825000 [Sesamum calycinum]|uniref:Reverse transcriptase Ty1/copia-type domain-containing protein n=1 Tax=Sesamum calycinum TaxID=2727403 RepID=A0AAW2ISZ3_9LAMI